MLTEMTFIGPKLVHEVVAAFNADGNVVAWPKLVGHDDGRTYADFTGDDFPEYKAYLHGFVVGYVRCKLGAEPVLDLASTEMKEVPLQSFPFQADIDLDRDA